MIYVQSGISHLHWQRGVHIRFALTHLQRVHRPLQEHLMSSLHTSETSGISIHTGVHKSSTLVQAKSSGDGMSGSA